MEEPCFPGAGEEREVGGGLDLVEPCLTIHLWVNTLLGSGKGEARGLRGGRVLSLGVGGCFLTSCPICLREAVAAPMTYTCSQYSRV